MRVLFILSGGPLHDAHVLLQRNTCWGQTDAVLNTRMCVCVPVCASLLLRLCLPVPLCVCVCRVKLCDFGCARHWDTKDVPQKRLARFSTFAGTPAYMSPQVGFDEASYISTSPTQPQGGCSSSNKGRMVNLEIEHRWQHITPAEGFF